MARITLERVSKSFPRAIHLPDLPGSLGMARPLADALVRQFGCPRGVVVEDDSNEAAGRSGPRPFALDGVNLEIQDGETMSVIGPSGCGKTTLLRVIAGLETPDCGRVLYDGRDMATVPPKDRRIGMVFQNYALYPHLKGRGNLSFFFRMHGREKEIDERVRAVSQTMGLGFSELLSRRPRSLSGGQKQRLAIARCIIRDPALFLFDEPLSSLDAKLRAQTRMEIKRLLQRFRITSVYVTHDQVEAVALADRMAVMREGRIEQVGTYWDLYNQPANVFVAGLVGMPPIALIPATCIGGRIVLPDGQALPVPESLQNQAETFGNLLLGLRAEHIKVADLTHIDGLLAQIELVERIPSERYQLVHLRTRSWKCVARAPARPHLRLDEWCRIFPDTERLLLFDAASGTRLAREEQPA